MVHCVTTELNTNPGCLIVLSLVCKCHEKGCWSVVKSLSKRIRFVGHIRCMAIIVEPTRPKPESSEEEEVEILVQEQREDTDITEMPIPEVLVTAEVTNTKGTENGEERAEVKEVSPPRYFN